MTDHVTTRLPDLHHRLIEAARRDDLLDVAYRTIDTPIGALLLARTPRGLVRVAFASEGHDQVLQSLSSALSPRVLEAPGALDDVAHELDDYFTGRDHTIDVPIDLALVSGFRREVIEALRGIRYGTRESYAQVADRVGNPRAVRAVGTACGHNPLPVVIGCHRVVRSDGQTGSYLDGPATKQWLLDHEASH